MFTNERMRNKSYTVLKYSRKIYPSQITCNSLTVPLYIPAHNVICLQSYTELSLRH